MRLSPDQITIAITVYNRRQYIKQAIASALNQTVPVKVIVVEDCGPDRGLENFVKGEFGSSVKYYRNPKRRGLFDNWNACIEYCETPWLSILHDDDWFEPCFAETMQWLHDETPNCGLYFGHTTVVGDTGEPLESWRRTPLNSAWKPVTVSDLSFTNPFSFPGHLFRVDYARDLHGFRPTSLYSGDWEFWIKMIAAYSGAQTGTVVAKFRHHSEWGRGTNKVLRSGRPYALYSVQRKRNISLLHKSGMPVKFDRRADLEKAPLPSRYLMDYGMYFSKRLLLYNEALFLQSKPPHWRYWLLQKSARVLGPLFLRIASRSWNASKLLLKHSRFPSY